ncbi:hypothetical protein FN846DRAFT_892931 [Sphaerosporella brunnea]|uniref:Uncharacterized protein n=1 Tax=Sphaerosporella brunnea TaxID=1250544 RepID=A0A5J5ENZ4_9PEZI|nr:hypothetical protein FN846DRAFT_892931 [Sphaerosporella brunnea]
MDFYKALEVLKYILAAEDQQTKAFNFSYSLGNVERPLNTARVSRVGAFKLKDVPTDLVCVTSLRSAILIAVKRSRKNHRAIKSEIEMLLNVSDATIHGLSQIIFYSPDYMEFGVTPGPSISTISIPFQGWRKRSSTKSSTASCGYTQ